METNHMRPSLLLEDSGFLGKQLRLFTQGSLVGRYSTLLSGLTGRQQSLPSQPSPIDTIMEQLLEASCS